MEEQTAMPTAKPKTNTLLIAIVVIVIVIIIAGGVFALTSKKETPIIVEQNNMPTNMPPTKMMNGNNMMKTTYKNGQYDATGNYVSPGGAEEVKVSLTLEDGIIKDITVTPQAFRPNSIKFQGLFAANYKPLVIGKNIDDVQLDKVGGSSLTPKGFNDAISQIKELAKS